MADFKDIGKEYGAEMAAPMKKEKYYPHLDFDLSDHPEFNKDIGDTCTFAVRARVISKRMDESSKSVCLEIREIAYGEPAKKTNEADEALASLKNAKRY